ncbi:MAG: Yqey-like protein, partial [Candidatus Parcubacteria bacterium]
MTVYETIQHDIKTAMKAGDAETLAVLRFVLSSLNTRKKEQEMCGEVMTDQDTI